jgi:hypothetical protein
MSNEVVAPVVESQVDAPKVRRATVADKDIIKAWQAMTLRKDENGKENGTTQEVADSLGMLKASLIQRITSLRGLGVKLNKMPRAQSTTVGNRKKDISKLQALLAEINDDLGIVDTAEAGEKSED